MAPKVIVHEYFTPGGPLTYEYPLNLPIPDQHLNLLSPFVRQFVDKTAIQIRNFFESRWRTIAKPLKPLVNDILSLDATSIAVMVDEEANPTFDSSVVFRRNDSCIYLIGESPNPSSEIRNAGWIQNVDGLPDLISHFGNTNLNEIPSCSGFGIGDRLIHEQDQQLCWGPTGSWENALPIFNPGNGYTVCVATDGKIGLWAIDKFIDVAANLTEFISMFIHRKSASKQDQWWW